MESPTVTLIIVSFNSAEVIDKCLGETINNSDHPVIIVDNASSDNSAEFLSIAYPLAQLIPLNTNLGYGRAANAALEKVTTTYALLLNPDVIISSAQITQLVQTAANLSDGAIFAPAVKGRDNSDQGTVEKPWVLGAAMLLKTASVKQAGLFDENIFLFYEEKDLCQRILNQGEKIYLLSDICIEHLKGKSSGPSDSIEHMKNWHVGWSSMYFFNKHHLNRGKRSAVRIMLKYFIKTHFSRDTKQRRKFASRLQGVRAFQRGENAFNKQGIARESVF